MKSDEVKIGERYVVRMGGRGRIVEITGETRDTYSNRRNWLGRMTDTGRSVRIRSAVRLREIERPRPTQQ